MNVRLWLAAAGLAASVALGSALVAAPAMAAGTASLNALKNVGAAQSSPVENVGWRNRCHWGIGGYHKYVRGVGRVQCTNRRCWRNRFGIKRCMWF